MNRGVGRWVSISLPTLSTIIMDWELLSSWLFCLASLILCLSEVYFAIRSSKGPVFLYRPLVTLSQCHQILNDFVSGIPT